MTADKVDHAANLREIARFVGSIYEGHAPKLLAAAAEIDRLKAACDKFSEAEILLAGKERDEVLYELKAAADRLTELGQTTLSIRDCIKRATNKPPAGEVEKELNGLWGVIEKDIKGAKP